MTDLAIVKGKAYKVKDGDSLKSIATNAGITWQDLARFNWGTDDPDRINTFLRNKVGCRKRTSDGKNYIFTSKDDPGIIHIPEDMPAKPFGSNATHTIIVDPADRKAYVPSKCLVKFRPASDWKGEFGFDWLRIGDRGSEEYKPPLLNGGFDASLANGLSANQAATSIKAEYKEIGTEVKGNPACHVPYLNLYPPGAKRSEMPTDPQPPCEATLELLITVEDQAADGLKIKVGDLEDDDDLSGDLVIPGKEKFFEFELAVGTTLPCSVGTIKTTLTIKCVKDLDAAKEINVYALTREKSGDLKAYIAGKVTVGANDKWNRKKLPFILVPVWTDVRGTGVPVKGSFTAAEKTNLRNALFQALLEGELLEVPGLFLDLSDNDDFKKVDSKGHQGMFYTKEDKGGLNQDDEQFYSTVKDTFLQMGDNNKYKDHFTVFAFGERPYDFALGQVQDIGKHNLIVFPTRDDCTTNHEVLHGLGLLHSFKENQKDNKGKIIGLCPPDKGAKFTFLQGKTDNVMDYTYDSSALITWRWQWQMINP